MILTVNFVLNNPVYIQKYYDFNAANLVGLKKRSNTYFYFVKFAYFCLEPLALRPIQSKLVFLRAVCSCCR